MGQILAHTNTEGGLDSRMLVVKRILVSQPEPVTDEVSPYKKLAEKYAVEITFRPFIQVEPLTSKEFRKQKVEILDHTAVIFTSRKAIDNFFRIVLELKIEIPVTMKYFCISEQTANYLQKYITVRKRKVFTGKKTAQDLIEIMKKYKGENYLFPCSEIRKNDIPDFFIENGYKFSEVVLYKTVASNLSDLGQIDYDMLAFFSPSGVSSLHANFPDFVQGNIRIAAFGTATAKAVRDSGLILDIAAPSPETPSMTGAIESYLEKVNSTK